MSAPRTNRFSEARIRVPFHDVDPMQVVWHGHYLKYFEVAREQLLHECGVDLQSHFVETGYAFPIVRSSVKHIRPLRLGDEFVCRAELIEAERRIVFEFAIHLADGGALCARGRTEQVAVKIPELELELNVPENIQRQLGYR